MSTKQSTNGTSDDNGFISSNLADSSNPISQASHPDSFTPSDREEAMRLLALLLEVLPPLRDLTAEERKSLSGMGDANRTFAGKILEVILQNPDFLPRTFDTEQYQRKLEAFDNLSTIARKMTQILALVNATMTAIGSEIHDGSLTVYRYANASGQGASLDAAKADLKQRFVSNSKGKKKDADKPDAEE
jgi:hypothetical protein